MAIFDSSFDATRAAIHAILPGYQLIETVYSGSRTVVYRAIRVADHCPVAIKLLKQEYPSFSELVQFRNQFTIAHTLNSPGIVKLYSLEPLRNGYALVMEFGGVSLSHYLQEQGAEQGLTVARLPVADFLPIALQLADILHELYRCQIIHKDLKPANILIDPDTRQVKLIDFSIASLLAKEPQDLQSPSVLEGTLAYLSPEQTGRMNRGIDYRSDFYSLGVTCFELLSGQLPFHATDPLELMHSHLAKYPPDLHRLNPAVPPTLSAIVSKLMAKNAEDRYQSARGLKHDLERCLQQWQVGENQPLTLGTRDLSNRFRIPETPYGRRASVEFDLATVLKASQALSSEIELDRLVSALLTVVIENAGAEKAALMLLQQECLMLVAVQTGDSGPQQLCAIPVESSQEVPASLVNAVKRHLHPTVVSDAIDQPQLATDPYIQQNQTRSVLCMPIVHQGKLIGVLYLENNRAAGAFTSDRVELLNLLCAQAAISLENARLYQQSQQTLAELRASEARFQKFADNLPGMIYQFHLAVDGRVSIPYISSGCADLYEMTPEAFMTGRRDIRSTEHPDDYAAVTQAITHAVQTLTPFKHEWRIITPSGAVKWVQTISHPERQADGSVLFNGLMLDISARKAAAAERQMAQAALQTSEQDLRTIFNSVSTAIVVHDLHGRILNVNDRMLQMFGVDRAHALRLSLLEDCSAPDNPFHLAPIYWKKTLAGEPVNFEWRVKRLDDGTVFDIEVSLTRIRLSGEMVILGSFQDISDRKRAEKALRLTQFSIDQSSVPIWWVKPNGQIFYVNDAACRDLGYSRTEILQKYVWDFNPDFSVDAWDAHWQDIVQQGSFTFETYNVNQSGHTYPVEVTVNYIELDGEAYNCGFVTNISDRKRAELERQKLAAVVENSGDFIGICNLDGQSLYLNPAGRQLIGLDSQTDITGVHIREHVYSPADWLHCQQALMQVFEQGSQCGELRFRHFQTGALIPVEFNTFLITDPTTGQPLCIATIIRDIRDRKRAEEEIKESKAFLNQVINVISDMIYVKDEQQRWVLVNQAFCDLMGADQASVLGKTDHDFFEQEHADIFWENDGAVFQSKLEQVDEELATDRNGQTCWLLTKKSYFENTEGQAFVVGYSRDITSLKRTEVTLREQEQFLRSIYEGSENIIFVVDVVDDSSFRYVGWNPAAEKASGICSTDVANKTLAEIWGDEQGRKLHQRFAERVSTGTPIVFEECLILHGQETWWVVNLNPVRNNEGRVYRIIGTTFNITDRKRIEDQLNQRTTELERTLQELQRTQMQMVQSEKMSGLGQLVAGVAHEINNPVNFIFGNLSHANSYTRDILELLKLYQKHYPIPDPEIQEYAEAIDLEFLLQDLLKLLASMRFGAERIQKIVASLRTFSRMDEAEVKAVNIHDGIDSTLVILQHRLKTTSNGNGIEVVKAYGDLPPVECYAGQLNQVFMNVLSNAIDALEEKIERQSEFKPLIKIHTECFNHHYVRISIADNGDGIPEHIRSRLFDPFFTTKPVGKGTGMGLSISHQIVTERHNGSFQCYSIPGQGTEFVIEIPDSKALPV